MNGISKLIFSVFAVTTLFACTNKNEANEKNFLNALKKHYENSDLCFTEKAPLEILNLNKTPSFQRDFLRQLSQEPTSNFGRLIGLERAGLIKKPNDSAKTYVLTDLGKKYSTEVKIHRPFQDDKPAIKFCWGKIEPSEIVNWDIPNANASSQRTIVTFKYHVAGLADWAKEKSIKDSYPQIGSLIEMQNKKEIKQALKLTNNGWQALE